MATATTDCSVPYNPSNQTRPSNAEDFPNFRDFQIVKMVKHFYVITDGSKQQLRLGFKCKTCSVTFNKTMQLLGHIRLHFEDEHMCRDCGKYFFDPKKLKIHVRAKHSLATVLRCQLGCEMFRTPSFKALQMHYERYHFVKIRMRELRKMEDAVRNGGTVMTQLVNLKPKPHRDGPPVEFRLPSSDEESQDPHEVAASDDGRLGQVETNPTPREAVEEDAEEEADSREGSMTVELPEDERVYDHMQCCVCGAIFGNEQQLETHVNSHTAPFECSFCSTAFAELAEIRVHYENKHQVTVKTPQFIFTNSPQPQMQHASWQQIVQSPQQQQPQVHHQQQQQHQIIHQQQQQQQQQIQHCTPTAQFIPSASNGAMTTMLVMQNGMLIPVHAIDSAQLAAVNPYQQTTATTLTPIGQNTQIAWPITATPITANHHHHHQLPQTQQILPPVQNQIEIIPLHGPAGTTTTTSPHGIITAIAPQHQQLQQMQGQPQQTLTPIQISLKDAAGNVISGGTGGTGSAGGYVINSIASIDPSYLKQIDPVLHQQQHQQQMQHQQMQAQLHQQQQLQQHQQYHS
uniref:C2H2-type domain-containing protein n=1 Tax=Anopheles atroparvus TaxID=41427 RepID=A0AAG5DBU5_ANOAO